MSSTCPIDNDQPIDQLKVTELNDELKRTKLVTKGLKEDLINCLDEVLAIEKEKDDVNGFNGNATDTVVTKSSKTGETDEKVNTAKVHPVETENEEMIPEVVNNGSEKSDITKLVGNDSSAMVGQELEHMDLSAGADSANVVEDSIYSSTKETAVTVAESVLTEVVVSVQEDSCIVEPPNGDGQDSVIKQENEESKPQLECDIKPSLGSQVKSDSVSSNCVSINQKNEPSSKIDVPVYGESHSMDVEELDEKKASVEENSSNNNILNLDKTISSDDVGYPEKLNLDGSSGDDSMEEDFPESKQFDSKFNVDKLGVKGESVERPIVKEERGTAVVGESLSSEKGGTDHNNIPSVSLVKKQLLHDRTSVRNNQPTKRQRTWNSKTVKGSNPQMSTVRPATAPKGEPNALKPKERIVPPSQRSPTNSLRIDNFLRPFTLKAVHELLDKTGNFSSFWMDEIKTHCYVSYSTVEEATETRNAVYNLQWPPNGGRLLVAEYVDPQEVQMKLRPPAHVAVNNDSTVPPETSTSLPEPSPGQRREQPPVPVTFPPPTPLSQVPPAAREWLPPPPLLPEPTQPLLSDPLPAARERLPPPPPPLSELPPAARERLPLPQSLPERVDRPIRTINDVFRKTRATPRIYYLPLSEEQVAAKLAAQRRSMEQ